MKRFFVIFLSALLILPVLLVPCFAASEYRFDYFQTAGTLNPVTIFRGISFIPDGLYSFEGFVSLGENTVHLAVESEPFDFVWNDSPDGFFVEVPVVFYDFDGSSFSDVITLNFYIQADYLLVSVAGSFPGDSYVVVTPVSDEPLTGQLLAIAQTAIDWCAEIAAVIVSRPLLLFTVGIFFLGGCIALFSRFLSRD